MANIPVYDPAGTQRTTPVRPVQVDADMFGAAQGRALAGVGQTLQGIGNRFLDKAEEERQRDQATKVTEATMRASAAVREGMFGEGGIYSQTGVNAEGAGERAREMFEKTKNEISAGLGSQEERDAFDRVFNSYAESNLNTVAKFEFDQRQATRTTAKASALDNITSDVIANFGNDDVLKTNFNMARGIIRANADGLPPEALAKLEREAISNLHLSVIQRKAIESPGAALDYYKQHQGEVDGVDHTKASSMIQQIGRIREVKDWVKETFDAGPANELVDALGFAETGHISSAAGRAAAVSPAGALGTYQVMPDTAREQAVALNMPEVAGMSDKQLQEYFATPEGALANKRIGTYYLGQQLKRFSRAGKADVEAAFVAYNAGPENAVKWLNAGRDYNALPKPQETLPYVRKALGRLRGQDFSKAQTSAEMQASLKGGGTSAYFQGDSKAFLKTRLQKQHGAEAIDGMSNALSDRMAALMNDAPDFVKEGLDILSGYRSIERQQVLWDKSDKTGKWVARPGGSQHNHGNASDLGWRGGKFSAAPKEVREWVHRNAATYGLAFPMDYEPWHIETAEARASGKQRDANFARAAGAAGVNVEGAEAFRAQGAPYRSTEDDAGFVTFAPDTGNAANIYMDAASPFTVDVNMGSMSSMLAAARERFADDPDKLAEAERQISIMAKQEEASQKEMVDQIKKGLLSNILTKGEDPRNANPEELAAIGVENIKQLTSLHDDWVTGGTRRTDPETYIELVNMDPEDFKNADITKYIPRLSIEDLKDFTKKQAELRRGNDVSSAMKSSMRNKKEIVDGSLAEAGILSSSTTQKQANAAIVSAFNRRLDTEIAAHIQRNGGKEPTPVEMQEMVDRLLIQGKKTSGWWGFRDGTTDRLFQVPAEEMSGFYAASNAGEIPPAALPDVRRVWGTLYRSMDAPNEEAAVSIYNDMVRVQSGGSPVPPPDLLPLIREGFLLEKKRAPLPDEEAGAYRRLLIGIANGTYTWRGQESDDGRQPIPTR